MTSSSSSQLDSLPYEILTSVLMPLQTRDLLPIALVNHGLRLIVSRILHRRILEASSLPENDLILECYHPSAKISTPYLSCTYQRTVIRDGPPINGESPDLSELNRLYSSFRPGVAEENRRPSLLPGLLVQEEEQATEDVYLDDGERFSQLCAVTNLVKQGPRRGLFISHVNISDGVVRIFREWLANMAGGMAIGEQDQHLSEDGRILWVDRWKDVGIRFQVNPGPAERMPLITGPGDDPPVSYRLVYEELLVRANKLLLAVENSAYQEVANSGRAIIIASV